MRAKQIKASNSETSFAKVNIQVKLYSMTKNNRLDSRIYAKATILVIGEFHFSVFSHHYVDIRH